MFETNVVGVASVIQAFLPLFRKRGPDAVKKILNISSLAGCINVVGSVDRCTHYPAYCVSKVALNMHTKMFANLLAKENFLIHSSHPGWVRTVMGGKDAPILPSESVAGMLKVLDNLTIEQNGTFWDHEGNELD